MSQMRMQKQIASVSRPEVSYQIEPVVQQEIKQVIQSVVIIALMSSGTSSGTIFQEHFIYSHNSNITLKDLLNDLLHIFENIAVCY